MVPRDQHLLRLEKLLRRNRIVGIVGARQVGKSTIAQALAARPKGPSTRFDLEDPIDLRRLEDPGLALRPLRGLVILDEIQRKQDLFPLLRVLADRRSPATRFLVLGSASLFLFVLQLKCVSPELMRTTACASVGSYRAVAANSTGVSGLMPSDS